MFAIELNMEMWPNLTQYLSTIYSWPFSILLINVRCRYRGDSPDLRHHCHLGLFQRHPIDKNDRASTYWSFIKPNPCFFGFTCSWWIYKSFLSSYEEQTYKTFALLEWQRHYSVDTWYAFISCIVPPSCIFPNHFSYYRFHSQSHLLKWEDKAIERRLSPRHLKVCLK